MESDKYFNHLGGLHFGIVDGFKLHKKLGCVTDEQLTSHLVDAVKLHLESMNISSIDGCLSYSRIDINNSNSYRFFIEYKFRRDTVNRNAYDAVAFVIKDCKVQPKEILQNLDLLKGRFFSAPLYDASFNIALFVRTTFETMTSSSLPKIKREEALYIDKPIDPEIREHFVKCAIASGYSRLYLAKEQLFKASGSIALLTLQHNGIISNEVENNLKPQTDSSPSNDSVLPHSSEDTSLATKIIRKFVPTWITNIPLPFFKNNKSQEAYGQSNHIEVNEIITRHIQEVKELQESLKQVAERVEIHYQSTLELQERLANSASTLGRSNYWTPLVIIVAFFIGILIASNFSWQSWLNSKEINNKSQPPTTLQPTPGQNVIASETPVSNQSELNPQPNSELGLTDIKYTNQLLTMERKKGGLTAERVIGIILEKNPKHIGQYYQNQKEALIQKVITLNAGCFDGTGKNALFNKCEGLARIPMYK